MKTVQAVPAEGRRNGFAVAIICIHTVALRLPKQPKYGILSWALRVRSLRVGQTAVEVTNG
jgi:hypothetical protein